MFRFAAVFAVSFALPAFALGDEAPNPPPSEGAAGIEGQFVFNQADGKARGCQVILFNEPAGGHLKSELAEDCATQFEFLGAVKSWELKGDAIELLDSAGTLVIEMAPKDQDTGMYRGTGAADGREYYLERTSG